MKTFKIPDPTESWAIVELYRWQYDELPDKNAKKLDISKALENMAQKMLIPNKEKQEIPSPFNVGMVLKYLATKNITL